MRCRYACGSMEHSLGRRAFLHSMLAGSGATMAFACGMGGTLMGNQAIADQLKSGSKRILNIFLHGGVSQLESWDPKPNTDTGGPFRAIPTSVPGMHISELLPHTARQMHHLSLIRSLDTKNGDHGRGQVEMTTGRKQMPGTDYPHLGAVAAKALTPDQFSLPGHILIRGAGSSNHKAAYLGPKYSSVVMEDGQPPQFTQRPDSLTTQVDLERQAFRQKLNDRFAGRRRTAIPMLTLTRTSKPRTCWPSARYSMSRRNPPKIKSVMARASLDGIASWPGDCSNTAYRSCKSIIPTMTLIMRTSISTSNNWANSICPLPL